MITEPSLKLAAISLTFSLFYAGICSWTQGRPDYAVTSSMEVYFDIAVSAGVIVANLLFCVAGIMVIVLHGWLAALGFGGFVLLGGLLLRLTVIMGFLFPPISLWLCNAAAVFFCIKAWFEK
jgi:hypothetical protein